MIKYLSKKFKENLGLILPVSFFVFILSAIVLGDVLAAGDIQIQFQVPFGEVKTGTVTNIAQYINAVYKYLVAAGGVLAGIMFAIGGFMYISSGGNASRAGKGKSYIISATLGLVLLVSSYVVLDVINPNTTELKDIAVEKIKQEKVIADNGVCKCNTDSDCPMVNTYCANDKNFPYDLNEANQKPALAILAEIVAATTLIAADIATGGITAFAKAAFKKGFKTLAKAGVKQFLKTTAKKSFKYIGKGLLFAVKKLGKIAISPVTTLLLIGGAVGLYLHAAGELGGFAIAFSSKCPAPKGKYICVPNIFKYNLIPHGLGKSNVPGIQIVDLNFEESITDEEMRIINAPRSFPYNKDGSLPIRETYFREKRLYYFEPPFASIDEPLMVVQGKLFQGMVNTDACVYKRNHCPCIEWEIWEPDKANYKCKNQSYCLVLDTQGGGILGARDGVGLCLTGGEGEMCLEDSHCQAGLVCKDLEKLAKEKGWGDDWRSYANDYSLMRKSIMDTKGSSQAGKINNKDWNRDKVCMTASSINATSKMVHGLGGVCESPYKCKKDVGLECKGRDLLYHQCFDTDFAMSVTCTHTTKEVDFCVSDQSFKSTQYEKISFNDFLSLFENATHNVESRVWVYSSESEYKAYPDFSATYKTVNYKRSYFDPGIQLAGSIFGYTELLGYNAKTKPAGILADSYYNYPYKDSTMNCTLEAFNKYLKEKVPNYLKSSSSYIKVGQAVYVRIPVNNAGNGGFYQYCKENNTYFDKSLCGCQMPIKEFMVDINAHHIDGFSKLRWQFPAIRILKGLNQGTYEEKIKTIPALP